MLGDTRSLLKTGIDIDETLRRFCGNEQLWVKFIKKFPDDPCIGGLREAMDTGDCQQMLHSAHTLKGVSGNLGFTHLYESCSALVTALRNDDQEGVPELFKRLEADYKDVIAAIDELK